MRNSRLGRRITVLAAVFAGFFALAGAALADGTPDPTGGVFTSAQSSLTTVIIPAAAALVVVGIIFAVAVKWMGKAIKKG